MGWLRLVGSLKLQVSFAQYSLFYRASFAVETYDAHQSGVSSWKNSALRTSVCMPATTCVKYVYSGMSISRASFAIHKVLRKNTTMLFLVTKRLHRVAWNHKMPYLHSRFLQKSPMISGSFAKNDLQLKASYESSPPCTTRSTGIRSIKGQ